MARPQVQPLPKKSKRSLVLAITLIVIVASAVAGFLFHAPSNVQLSIKDPPQSSYDPSIQAIYVTFTSIEVHTVNAATTAAGKP